MNRSPPKAFNFTPQTLHTAGKQQATQVKGQCELLLSHTCRLRLAIPPPPPKKKTHACCTTGMPPSPPHPRYPFLPPRYPCRGGLALAIKLCRTESQRKELVWTSQAMSAIVFIRFTLSSGLSVHAGATKPSFGALHLLDHVDPLQRMLQAPSLS